jgi:hypothetical protein
VYQRLQTNLFLGGCDEDWQFDIRSYDNNAHPPPLLPCCSLLTQQAPLIVLCVGDTQPLTVTVQRSASVRW